MGANSPPSSATAWAAKPSVQVRAKQLNEGFIAWLEEHSKSNRELPGLPYLMLHALACALVDRRPYFRERKRKRLSYLSR